MKRLWTALLLMSAVCALGTLALAQKQKEDLTVRSCEGAVTDADGNPAHGAVVYLTNAKTLQIRTYNADEQGHYIFHGLSVNVDYRLKAKLGGTESDEKTLSVFDSKRKPVINLKLKK